VATDIAFDRFLRTVVGWRMPPAPQPGATAWPQQRLDLLLTEEEAAAMTAHISKPLSATAAFYQRAGGVRLLRWALGSAQGLWPSMAQRLAKRLFLTSLPLKWLQRRGHWEPRWRIERWPFERASLTLYGTHHTADRLQPVALLLHGWGGNAAQMKPLAEALHTRGWATLIVELPGHGRSAGMSSSLAQFARALDYVHARLVADGRQVGALLAHSLGANASAYAVARGLTVNKLVLLAAPDAPQAYTQMFAQVFGLREHNRARMQQRIEAQEAIVMEQFDAEHSGPGVQTPTLVVHDRSDSINTFAGAERLAGHLPQALLHSTEGLGHRRILRDQGVMDAVLRFLED
jgi:pimeloyl-ACP methyl ester carboxylesterase